MSASVSRVTGFASIQAPVLASRRSIEGRTRDKLRRDLASRTEGRVIEGCQVLLHGAARSLGIWGRGFPPCRTEKIVMRNDGGSESERRMIWRLVFWQTRSLM